MHSLGRRCNRHCVLRVPSGATGHTPSAKPRAARLYAEVLLKFIVDTAGRVDLTTVKVMKSERAAATRRLEKALPSLEFEPAIREGCRVRQVVQRPFY